MPSVILARLASLPVLLATVWAGLVLAFSPILPATWRTAASIGVAALGLWCFVSIWRRRAYFSATAVFAVALTAVILGWQGLRPSNARNWQPDVALPANATFDGDLVTVHNIRNFDYRTADDYTPHYYDRTFDIMKLTGVDLYAVYWMGPAIAHIFVSFEFEDGGHLAISIETRKERGEAYSTLLGFFRQYELFYVVADERDVVRLRTNFRVPPEDVYRYRLQAPIENGRRVFLEYMRHLNALVANPEFYNTLEDNCTTGAWLNTRVNDDRPPFSWKLLASGYTPQYLYDVGRIDRSLPFSELQARGHVNARARAAGDALDFSQRIRSDAAP